MTRQVPPPQNGGLLQPLLEMMPGRQGRGGFHLLLNRHSVTKGSTVRLYPIGLVATLALAVLVVPLAANAQPLGKVFRVGVLLPASPGTPVFQVFTQRLQELGYIDGQNLALAVRAAEGQFERLPSLAAELVRLHVDVIVATGPEATLRAARDATDTIPIVMRARDDDHITLGYVAGLARPGGNITGVVEQRLEVMVKQLELLKEALSTVTRVAVLWDDASADQRIAAEAAAQPLGVRFQLLELHQPPYKFAGAFATATQDSVSYETAGEEGLG